MSEGYTIIEHGNGSFNLWVHAMLIPWLVLFFILSKFPWTPLNSLLPPLDQFILLALEAIYNDQLFYQPFSFWDVEGKPEHQQ